VPAISEIIRRSTNTGLKKLIVANTAKTGLMTGTAVAGTAILGGGAAAGYNKFSGSDDNFNTIPGLRHGGFAERIRKEFSDFGSGFRSFFGAIGKLFKRPPKFSKTKGFTQRELKSLAKYASKTTPEDFAKLLDVKLIKAPKEILALEGGGGWNIPPEAISNVLIPKSKNIWFQHGLKGNKAYVDPSVIGKSLHGSTGTAKEQAAYLKLVIFHEAAELRNVRELAKGKTTPLEFKELILGKKAHKATLPQEEFFIRQYRKDPKLYEKFQLIRRRSDPEYGGYLTTTSTKNIFNTIEGIKDIGLSEEVRHKLTSFGSKWQKFKSIKKYVSKSSKVSNYSEILQDPRRPKRIENFRKISTAAVGLGHRAAYNAGRRHSRFPSTGV
jgi:hypothetical protein